jgi:two-component system chemotaxis response regulator CheB
MPEILARRSPLPVAEASAGMHIQPGHVYIAPSNQHLLVHSGGVLALTQTELVHFVRPSADLLFESVAASFRERAIAVVLSGTGEDGAMGVTAIKKMGGTVVVQDPQGSEFPGMPHAARRTGAADLVLPLDEIAPALQRLCAPSPREP